MIRTKTNNLKVIIAYDPSFTAWGYAVISLSYEKVIEAGCIKTVPENKKRRIRKGDDTIRRINEIYKRLVSIAKKYKTQLILCESPHGSQNASAAVMIGAVTALAYCIAEQINCPIEWFSEGDAKKHLLNKKAATKDEIIKAIDKIYDIPWKGIKYKDEAIADAMSIYNVAKEQSSIIKHLLSNQ